MSPSEYKNLPKIAIIGRPNVGKSSIFNRILKRRKAVVDSSSGVTRDRLYAQVRLQAARPSNVRPGQVGSREGEVDFVLIDTGGLVSKPKEKIAHLVYNQSRQAIDESDGVIFVCDLSSGITYQDEQIASILKKSGKRTFLVVNKTDHPRLKNDIFEFYKLGLGEPYGVSCLHNRGLGQLEQDMAGHISGLRNQQQKEVSAPALPVDKEQEGGGLLEPAVKIAVVGRPNVGKSSFINCLINQERLLVDETPGTTRDAVDIHIKRDKAPLVMVDTAGIRHKKKIKETVEMFSLARAKQSIRRCDIALVMIDATAGLFRDDIAVIDYVIKEGRCCLLAVNKMDLAKDLNIQEYKKALRFRFRPAEWMPIIFTSCKEKKNIIKAVEKALGVVKKSRLSVPTAQINELLEELQRLKPHPYCGRARPRIYYGTQIGASPPKFLLFVTEPKDIKKEYLKFIEHRFRRRFDLEGVPIIFHLRAKR